MEQMDNRDRFVSELSHFSYLRVVNFDISIDGEDKDGTAFGQEDFIFSGVGWVSLVIHRDTMESSVVLTPDDKEGMGIEILHLFWKSEA